MVHQGNEFSAPEQAVHLTEGDLKGIGCCPGVVRGPVRVINDPRNALLSAGEILVAERTDPGWIMLFPAAAGILVERGSLLSHSAIVAREMGIPAIVSVPGITRSLSDGEWVEFDGSSGVIQRIESQAKAVHGQ
jgi:pyruvate,water dikinase